MSALLVDSLIFFTIVASLSCAGYLESVNQVVKYSFYDTHPFNGGLYGNVLLILSRLFVGVGTIGLAMTMEARGATVNFVSGVVISTSALSALSTSMLLRRHIEQVEAPSFSHRWLLNLLLGKLFVDSSASHPSRFLRAYMAPLAFVNAVGFLFMYLVAAVFPDFRLTISALTPVLSMIGTVYFALMLEPKLSNMLVRREIHSREAKNAMLLLRIWGYAFSLVLVLIFVSLSHILA